ncbi:hypothetical protein [Bradyrhizobium sp. Ash2021]|uniref:hypothetical protein n=1 Tax=Bradyrhizobium sp. Ash2021 TaxID=2954771 RepID=UPI0028152AB4|nr:hypothetical protein [Bradyrhizobium sp. Ash2021]WMT75081.1 hypothetical protein NL528_01155 [Bradyrhizobium sp. Ash2021]
MISDHSKRKLVQKTVETIRATVGDQYRVQIVSEDPLQVIITERAKLDEKTRANLRAEADGLIAAIPKDVWAALSAFRASARGNYKGTPETLDSFMAAVETVAMEALQAEQARIIGFKR